MPGGTPSSKVKFEPPRPEPTTCYNRRLSGSHQSPYARTLISCGKSPAISAVHLKHSDPPSRQNVQDRLDPGGAFPGREASKVETVPYLPRNGERSPSPALEPASPKERRGHARLSTR